MSAPAAINNPGVLGLVGLALLAALTLLALGLFHLATAQGGEPAVVAIDKAKLGEALMEAPWISSESQYDDSGDDDQGPPVLWYVTAPDCAPCRAFEKREMPKLLDRGVEVRAILLAPRSLKAGAPDGAAIAELVKKRDWTALQLWMQGKHQSGEPVDQYEQEGVLEWSRQSGERIGALMTRNDLKFAAPELFWQRGVEWRAAPLSGGALGEVERDLAPKA